MSRVVVLSLALVLMALGVRSLVSPVRAVNPLPTNTFPADAAAVAARFATTYLTTDVDPAARTAALGLDVAPDATVVTDWQGSGTTHTDAVYPAGVQVSLNGASALATVVAHVVTTPSRTDAKTLSSATWLGLAIPLQSSGGRAVVSGTPAFVSLPPAGAVSRRSGQQPSSDDALGAATRDGVQAFFQAYGSSDAAAVEQAAAPGAAIQPLGAGLRFAALGAWVVDQGSGATRIGHATVTWALTGAGTVQQSYRVELISTSAGGTQAWRVRSISADTATPEGVSR